MGFFDCVGNGAGSRFLCSMAGFSYFCHGWAASFRRGRGASSSGLPDLNLPAPEPQARFPTKGKVENKLKSFLDSFCSRGVTTNSLEKAKNELNLNTASPQKLAKLMELMSENGPISNQPIPAFEARNVLVEEILRWEAGPNA